jgi:hypothetical protein
LFHEGRLAESGFEAFLAALHPGDPPGGQRYLRAAFSHYRDALAAPDERTRAQFLLLANLEIGFHEQTRLQPEILEAMNAPVMHPRELRRRLIAELFPNPSAKARYWLARLSRRASPLVLARDQFADELQRVGRKVVTSELMTLTLPGRRLRLGDPLPDGVPEILTAIDLPELAQFLGTLGPTDAEGAIDWSDLPARMRFIAALFRTYHPAPELFAPPFAPAQVTDIRAGRRPSGNL